MKTKHKHTWKDHSEFGKLYCDCGSVKEEFTETNAKHTPGPWTIDDNRNLEEDPGIDINQADGGRVALVAPTPDEPERSMIDARLIAAAPELLEACKRALRIENAMLKDAVENRNDAEQTGCEMNIAVYESAIAKAEGRS
jgi:hypothetical protein